MNGALFGTIVVQESQRQGFRDGPLRDAWARAYPMIFDEKDLEIARNQPKYHFYEWLAAVHFFQTGGCLSLVKQYEFASHERKQAVLERLVPVGVRRLLAEARLSGVQCPDLFVYCEDGHEWCFCEVKGPGDWLRPKQEEFFRELSGRSGKPVEIVKVIVRAELL